MQGEIPIFDFTPAKIIATCLKSWGMLEKNYFERNF